MTNASPVSEMGNLGLPPRLERPLLFLFGALASTLLLKIAGIQYLEILELALVGYIAFRFFRASYRIELSRIVARLGGHYTVLGVLIGAGALLALDRPVYAQTSGLYQLGVFSASRLLELLLDVTATLVLTEVFRRKPSTCLFTMRVYFWVGTLSASAGAIATVVHLQRFSAGGRAIGFFNEGGPFGLYLLSNIAVGLVLRTAERGRIKTAVAAAFLPNAAALALSASKAALAAILVVVLLQALLASSLRQRMVVAVIFGVVGVTLSYTNLSRGIANYRAAADQYVTLSNIAPNDYNLVGGRVAGLFLVPRMIAVHPWVGIGFANYGLVRNASEYRGGAAWANVADSPGLGLIGLAAEIGIPLSLYLLYILFLPVVAVRRAGWWPLITLILVQPVVHLFGAQLNLTYPWITTAFALGLAGAGINARTVHSLTVAAQPAALNHPWLRAIAPRQPSS